MGYDIENIAELLSLLPPPPQAWVEAAQAMPQLRVALDGLVERARENADERARIVADLESALAASGVTPTPQALAAARRRLEA